MREERRKREIWEGRDHYEVVGKCCPKACRLCVCKGSLPGLVGRGEERKSSPLHQFGIRTMSIKK